MRDHGDAAFALHPLDERAPAARHDHVDEIGHRQHQADGRAIARRHELHGLARQSGGIERALQRRDNRPGRVEAFRAAAQDHRVAGPQAQSRRIGGDVGARFVDDADDAQRDAHARDVEPVGTLPPRELGADGIGQARDLLEPPRHRFDALVVERQPVAQRRRQRDGRGRGEVAAIGGEDRRRILAQRRGRRLERRGLDLGCQSRKHGGRAPRRGADRAHLALEIVRHRFQHGHSRLMSPPPDRRGGSSRRGHGSRGWSRFHGFCGRQWRGHRRWNRR